MSEKCPTTQDKVKKARALIHGLCQPCGSSEERKWTMHIPVDRERDSDVILCDALNALEDDLSAANAARVQAEAKAASAEYWNKWVYPEGATAEQVQAELQDYREIIDEVSKVYCEITGGKISKPNTKAVEVIQCVEDEIQAAREKAEGEVERLREQLTTAATALASSWAQRWHNDPNLWNCFRCNAVGEHPDTMEHAPGCWVVEARKILAALAGQPEEGDTNDRS